MKLSELTERRLTLEDAAAGARLSELAGWSGAAEDWRARIAHSGGFCLCDKSGLIVAAGLIFSFAPRMAFIGNILVDPAWRGRSLGRLMTERCLAWLQAMGMPAYLIATPLGLPIYLKLGFIEIGRLVHLRMDEETIIAAAPGHCEIRAMARSDLEAVFALDAAVYGGDRAVMLQPQLTGDPSPGVVATSAGRIVGYACPARRRGYSAIGPLLAPDGATALALFHALRNRLPGPVGCDVPAYQTAFIDALTGAGYRRVEDVPLMGHGTDLTWPFARPAELFTTAARAAC